ncbi:hypothetical protein BGW36DRAFT_405421 [Talaromyces proteolyticus]|uniref:Uncharacterized protein n=1 Tax=Talaromyces proteolyticus TaxID=1131652 RepID=A0AAD4PZT0_9EURO|nr:uncharacterized protein BGW36DRAFT_405421 [Talaromyces proteolyticus]KAH8700114.1 hypothetical protein BGW36DRAFT_405421 [Talaromyces proteolyticus]
MPNILSDNEAEAWLEELVTYLRTNPDASWWNTHHSGSWACWAFFAKTKDQRTWMYTRSKDAKQRPITVLEFMSQYSFRKPWLIKLPGMETPEAEYASIRGRTYVPFLCHGQQDKVNKRIIERGEEIKEQNTKNMKTEIRFLLEPATMVREVSKVDSKESGRLICEDT